MGKFSVASLMLALLAAPASGVQFTPLDVPGGPTGISGTNIVGTYEDPAGTNHGYLYNGSTTTPIDDPSAITGLGRGTFATGISGSEVVGYFVPSGSPDQGFIYNGSTFATLSNGPYGTQANGISGNDIVGSYQDASFGFHGFIYDGSSFTTVNDPLGSNSTVLTGVYGNNAVGYYVTAGAAQKGFLYNGSSFLPLADPLATGGTTSPTGIYGNDVVGYYTDSTNARHGFLYNGSTYTTVDNPAAVFGPNMGSVITGICGNTIIGNYSVTNGARAYTATIPEPPSIAMLAIGAVGVSVLARGATIASKPVARTSNSRDGGPARRTQSWCAARGHADARAPSASMGKAAPTALQGFE